MNKVIINKLKLSDFGKFHDKTIELDDKFNIIYGLNESGKSTICDFIEGMFYGFDDGDKKRNLNYKYKRYKPLFSNMYQGSMEITKNNERFLIYRDFFNFDFQITNLTSGDKVFLKESNLNSIGEYFLGFNYKIYKSIVSLNQFEKMDRDLNLTIKDKLINLKSGGDIYFKTDKAIDILDKRLNSIGTDRAYTKKYAKTKKKIDLLNDKLNEINKLEKDYEDNFKEIYNIRENIKDMEDEASNLNKEKTLYNLSRKKENLSQIDKLKEEQIDLNNKLNRLKKYENLDFSFFDKVDNLIAKELELSNNLEKYENHDKNFVIFMITLVIACIIFISIKFRNYFVLFLIVPIVFMYLRSNRNSDYISERQKYVNTKVNLQNEFLKINVKNKAEYERFKKDYNEYDRLIKDKIRVENSLYILMKNTEITNEDYELLNSNLKTNYNNIDEINSKIKSIELKLPSMRRKQLDLEKKVSYIEQSISCKNKIIEEINFLKEEFILLDKKKKALELSIDILKKSSQKIGNRSKDIIIDKVSELIKNISSNDYVKVWFDDNLNPFIRTKSDKYIDIENLSTSFKDQIDFALKFVLAQNIIENSFMVFDDAFINYDNLRLRLTMFYLLDQSENNQIIYFTCHNREEYILKNEGIDIEVYKLEEK